MGLKEIIDSYKEFYRVQALPGIHVIKNQKKYIKKLYKEDKIKAQKYILNLLEKWEKKYDK